jgi:hypothetical protein
MLSTSSPPNPPATVLRTSATNRVFEAVGKPTDLLWRGRLSEGVSWIQQNAPSKMPPRATGLQ